MPYPVTTDKNLSAPLSVSQLNGQARRLLETNFNNVRVEGELSSLARPSSGHWYFTLKDDKAQVRCAMFRNRSQSLAFTPSEGMLVQVRARVSLYENRGDYQLIIEHMKAAGSGALQQAYDALKRKLAEEGLFDSGKKRPLPAFPKHIAIITSPTGAAVRDILSVLKRRAPFIPVTVVPAVVQGQEAAGALIQALNTVANTDCDVIIIGRGGGSLEDLWAFNDEHLARTIASHPTPVVSAVGHEVDFTIADFVADLRAPTPSAAAEILTPDTHALHDKTQLLCRKLAMNMRHRLQAYEEQLNHISKRLRHPGDQLREQAQRLDDLEIRLQQAMRLNIAQQQGHFQHTQYRLQQLSPAARIQQLRLILKNHCALLQDRAESRLASHRHHLQQLSSKLNAISPLATLARGYAILQSGNQVVSDSHQLNINDTISVKLDKGQVSCQVTDLQHLD